MSNVGPQLVRQLVRAALWSGPATGVSLALVGPRIQTPSQAPVPRGICSRAVRPLAARSPPACRRRSECAVSRSAGLARKSQCNGHAGHRPFQARRAVRPSAASGRSVRRGASEVWSSLEPRPPLARLLLAREREPCSIRCGTLRCGPVWLPSANACSSLPRLAVAQPVDRADVLKRAAHALARRSCQTLGPSWWGSLYALHCGRGRQLGFLSRS